RAPMATATTTVAANKPKRRSTPAASAASEPVNAACERASPVKSCLRITRKYPIRPQQAPVAEPATRARTMKGWENISAGPPCGRSAPSHDFRHPRPARDALRKDSRDVDAEG